jgi:hypothetical protein
MTHHSLPITYLNKADAVFAGACNQTIRMGDRYRVGDRLTIYEWSGKPYQSKWGRRIKAEVVETFGIKISDKGIATENLINTRFGFPSMPIVLWGENTGEYQSNIAELDGIHPPTNHELRRVLESFHGPFTDEPVEAQIIRWKIIEEAK